jgi:hypothetical protein
MVEGELVLNAVKDSSLDSRRSERLGADPLRMTLIPDNLQFIIAAVHPAGSIATDAAMFQRSRASSWSGWMTTV